jgi:hypothetical protein
LLYQLSYSTKSGRKYNINDSISLYSLIFL